MILEKITKELMRMQVVVPIGRISKATGGTIEVSGLEHAARLGDRLTCLVSGRSISGEIIRIEHGKLHMMPEQSAEGIALGDPVLHEQQRVFAPDENWIGRIVDPDGKPLDGRPLLPGLQSRRLRNEPPHPHQRRAMGQRLETGLAVFDTMLPLVRGQRIGLFAGAGVGKTTLLGDLALGVDAEVIVIGLVGERGRELRHFVENVLGENGMKRTVVVAATSDRSPQTRRRCAWAATAVAEYFRDEGKQVLLLIDSVTRFAEAHRELAAASGEPTALRGYPATTGPTIAALCERAGPGINNTGDITAVYSVLVAGSDMDEPVADMLRGVLDGHVVLDRSIAERGRFPAVDLLRSVSRSLPAAATSEENIMIGQARKLIGTYDQAEMMIQAGLYTSGADAAIDAAIASHTALEAFLARRGSGSIPASFRLLKQALAAARIKAD